MNPSDFCRWLSGVLDTVRVNDDGSNLGVSRMVEMLGEKLKTVEYDPVKLVRGPVVHPAGEWGPAFDPTPVRKIIPKVPPHRIWASAPGDLGHE